MLGMLTMETVFGPRQDAVHAHDGELHGHEPAGERHGHGGGGGAGEGEAEWHGAGRWAVGVFEGEAAFAGHGAGGEVCGGGVEVGVDVELGVGRGVGRVFG